jgi:hypothetical protein
MKIKMSYITCRLILANGTVFPVSFAVRFNCSLTLTRVKKSVRHFECLTKNTFEYFPNKSYTTYYVQYEH